MMDPECMQLVKTEYAKLEDAIGDLGTMIAGTLERQREEIQRSHKSQMRKVQVNVDNLQLEKSRLEESIATNERACLLENERDWFKKEALHLDKVLQQTKARQKELIEQLDESKQDREFMKSQIEKVTKRNWVLEKQLKELGVDLNDLFGEDIANGEMSEAEDKAECSGGTGFHAEAS